MKRLITTVMMIKVLDNSYISDANYIGDRWKVKIVLVGNSDQITNY